MERVRTQSDVNSLNKFFSFVSLPRMVFDTLSDRSSTVVRCNYAGPLLSPTVSSKMAKGDNFPKVSRFQAPAGKYTFMTRTLERDHMWTVKLIAGAATITTPASPFVPLIQRSEFSAVRTGKCCAFSVTFTKPSVLLILETSAGVKITQKRENVVKPDDDWVRKDFSKFFESFGSWERAAFVLKNSKLFHRPSGSFFTIKNSTRWLRIYDVSNGRKALLTVLDGVIRIVPMTSSRDLARSLLAVDTKGKIIDLPQLYLYDEVARKFTATSFGWCWMPLYMAHGLEPKTRLIGSFISLNRLRNDGVPSFTCSFSSVCGMLHATRLGNAVSASFPGETFVGAGDGGNAVSFMASVTNAMSQEELFDSKLTSLVNKLSQKDGSLLLEVTDRELSALVNAKVEGLRNRNEAVVSVSLPAEEKSKLVKTFPELRISFRDCVNSSHPMCNAVRTCFNALFINKYKHVKHADIGGSLSHHIRSGNVNGHCCNPILDRKDVGRRIGDLMALGASEDPNTMKDLIKVSAATGLATCCMKASQYCYERCEAGFAVVVYDADIYTLVDAMAIKKIRTFDCVFMFPIELVPKEGEVVIPDLGVRVVRRGTTLLYYVGGVGDAYKHDLNKVMSLLTCPMVTASNGMNYSTEYVGYRLGYHHISFNMAASEDDIVVVDRAISTTFKGNVMVRIPVFEGDMIRFKEIFVEKDFIDRLFCYMLNVTTGFSERAVEYCISCFRSQKTHVIVGTRVVHSKINVEHGDEMGIVLAVMIDAIRARKRGGALVKEVEAMTGSLWAVIKTIFRRLKKRTTSLMLGSLEDWVAEFSPDLAHLIATDSKLLMEVPDTVSINISAEVYGCSFDFSSAIPAAAKEKIRRCREDMKRMVSESVMADAHRVLKKIKQSKRQDGDESAVTVTEDELITFVSENLDDLHMHLRAIKPFGGGKQSLAAGALSKVPSFFGSPRVASKIAKAAIVTPNLMAVGVTGLLQTGETPEVEPSAFQTWSDFFAGRGKQLLNEYASKKSLAFASVALAAVGLAFCLRKEGNRRKVVRSLAKGGRGLAELLETSKDVGLRVVKKGSGVAAAIADDVQMNLGDSFSAGQARGSYLGVGLGLAVSLYPKAILLAPVAPRSVGKGAVCGMGLGAVKALKDRNYPRAAISAGLALIVYHLLKRSRRPRQIVEVEPIRRNDFYKSVSYYFATNATPFYNGARNPNADKEDHPPQADSPRRDDAQPSASSEAVFPDESESSEVSSESLGSDESTVSSTVEVETTPPSSKESVLLIEEPNEQLNTDGGNTSAFRCSCGVELPTGKVEKEIPELVFVDKLKGREAIFFSRQGQSYSYGRIKHASSGWPAFLDELLQDQPNSEDYNHCLVQRYSEGGFIPFHSDNETCYDSKVRVLTMNFGGRAEFTVKCRKGGNTIELLPNTTLLMPEGFQSTHEHSVLAATPGRISFTFRNSNLKKEETLSKVAKAYVPPHKARSIPEAEIASSKINSTIHVMIKAGLKQTNGWMFSSEPILALSGDSAPPTTSKISETGDEAPVVEYILYLARRVYVLFHCLYKLALVLSKEPSMAKNIPQYYRENLPGLRAYSLVNYRLQIVSESLSEIFDVPYVFSVNLKKFIPGGCLKTMCSQDDVLLVCEEQLVAHDCLNLKGCLALAAGGLVGKNLKNIKKKFVNSPPGGGKTTRLVRESFDKGMSANIATANVGSSQDINSAIAKKLEAERQITNTPVRYSRTLNSWIINPGRGENGGKMLVDEVYLMHQGQFALGLFAMGGTECIAFGDVNQIPFINREVCFPMRHEKIDTSDGEFEYTTTSYRCPADVRYYLSSLKDGKKGQLYPGGVKPFGSEKPLRSLEKIAIASEEDVLAEEADAYLTFNQDDKGKLLRAAAATGQKITAMTIHEAQGKTFERVVLARLKKPDDSVMSSRPHILVGLSRHTKSLKYATYNAKLDDPLGSAISSVDGATVSDALLVNLQRLDRFRDH
uniref:ORF1a n=1 Tax=peony leafroll-associated virus TaxID=2974943 RepID=A0A977XRX8_9CLOS|nr:ORF1a [peony leafroll-associated virus]